MWGKKASFEGLPNDISQRDLVILSVSSTKLRSRNCVAQQNCVVDKSSRLGTSVVDVTHNKIRENITRNKIKEYVTCVTCYVWLRKNIYIRSMGKCPLKHILKWFCCARSSTMKESVKRIPLAPLGLWALKALMMMLPPWELNSFIIILIIYIITFIKSIHCFENELC